jgi:hypothetical protein
MERDTNDFGCAKSLFMISLVFLHAPDIVGRFDTMKNMRYEHWKHSNTRIANAT